MTKYRCKKQFYLPKYDEYGHLIENEYNLIKVNEIFECNEFENLFVASKPAIRLENALRWIEITPQTLKKYFEEI